MGRIGKAIAKRLDAFGVPVVYHSRKPQAGVAYKYYPSWSTWRATSTR